jgi:hypothetical protein
VANAQSSELQEGEDAQVPFSPSPRPSLEQLPCISPAMATAHYLSTSCPTPCLPSLQAILHPSLQFKRHLKVRWSPRPFSGPFPGCLPDLSYHPPHLSFNSCWLPGFFLPSSPLHLSFSTCYSFCLDANQAKISPRSFLLSA